MLLDNEWAIRTLKLIIRYEENYLKSAKNPRRKMRPSERAMTIAHYDENIKALQYAIKHLEGEKPDAKA